MRLRETHPEAFEEAKSYEKSALEHGSPFTWSQGESLIELSEPGRVAQIKADYDVRVARQLARRAANPLREEVCAIDTDELFGSAKGCLTCHK